MALDRTKTVRGALAGAAAAGIWSAQSQLDRRVFGVDYLDEALLGKAVTRGSNTTKSKQEDIHRSRESPPCQQGLVEVVDAEDAAVELGLRRPDAGGGGAGEGPANGLRAIESHRRTVTPRPVTDVSRCVDGDTLLEPAR